MIARASIIAVGMALAGCGAQTVRARERAQEDAGVDALVPVDLVVPDEPVEDVVVKDVAVEDVAVVVDVAPPCDDNVVCTDGVGECQIGRTRCVDGRSFCRAAGNQLPGTSCVGGACDGRGGCRMNDQRSCSSPSETGCGIVFLTGGTFTLGDASGYRSSPPQRSITVGGYTLDAYEVTVARFRRYWEAGRPGVVGAVMYPSGPAAWRGPVTEPVGMPSDGARCNWTRAGRDYHPINCVDHATAQAFCVWDGGRLPTEAEWEFAARQQLSAGLSAGRRYPWGETPPSATCDRAQWRSCAGDDGGATRRVGSFTNTAGFFDLAGNVWEWTGDLFAPYSDPRCWGAGGGNPRANPRCDANATGYPSIRGGSWLSMDAALLQTIARDDAYMPTTRSPLVGFRCARTRVR